MKNIPLKICGITNVKSVEVAHKNKIKSLGFASKNLNGPNTVSDKKIQSLIKECKNYKIESVLLTQYVSCLLYTSPSPRDRQKSRMPSSA